MPTPLRYVVRRAPTALLLVPVLVAALLLARATPASASTMRITAGPKVNVATHQVTIWWYSSHSGSSELRWDTKSASFAELAHDVSNMRTDLGTVHSRTISHLPAGTYYFRVRSSGAAGTATSAAHSFTVGATNATSALGALTADERVHASVIDTVRNQAIIGGQFRSMSLRRGDGVTVDSTSAAYLPGQPIVAGTVYASAPDGEGGTYIGGDFTHVGGLQRGRLARLLPDGGLTRGSRHRATDACTASSARMRRCSSGVSSDR